MELDDRECVVSCRYNDKIEFLNMNLNEITESIDIDKYFFSDSKNEMILMNKNDLLLAGKKGINIIDVQEKTIVKRIEISSL